MREFAADFEWVEKARNRSACQLAGRGPWNHALRVFDPTSRNEGFRWLSDAEINDGRQSRHRDTRGRCFKPRAVFFHAKIQNALMDCHPERVKLIPKKGGVADVAQGSC